MLDEMHTNHYRWRQRTIPQKLQSTGSVQIDTNDMRVTILWGAFIVALLSVVDMNLEQSSMLYALACSRVCGCDRGIVRRAATIFDH